MPIVDDDVIIEVEFTNGVGSSDPLSFSYLGITGLDTSRSAASQLTILAYFTEFSDGTTVGNATFTNWYDPYLIQPSDSSGNIFLEFDDARGIVTIQNLQLSTVTLKDGSTKTRKALSDSTYTKVRMMRSQNITNKAHTFQSGSRITSDSLNNAIGQVFDATQELDDRLVRVEGATFEEVLGITLESLGDVNINSKTAWDVVRWNGSKFVNDQMDAAQISTGTLNNDRLSSAIPVSKLTGTLANAQVQQSNVTQHATAVGNAIPLTTLSDVNITGIIGNGSFIAYDTSSSKFVNKSPADSRTALGLGTLATASTITDSYTGHIETAAAKQYFLDPHVATARTITGLYIKSGAGTATAKFLNGTDVIKQSIAVSTSSGDESSSISNTSLAADGSLILEFTGSPSATDVIFTVEYTQ